MKTVIVMGHRKPFTTACPARQCQLAVPGQHRTQPCVAQQQPAPPEGAENEAKDDGKPAILAPYMRGDRAAEIARQQDGTQRRGARDQIEDGAAGEHNPEGDNDAFREAEVACRLHDEPRLDELHGGGEQEEELRQGADNAAGPEPAFPTGAGACAGCRDFAGSTELAKAWLMTFSAGSW